MPKLFTTDEFKKLLKAVNTSHEKFAEKSYLTPEALKEVFRGKTKFTGERQLKFREEINEIRKKQVVEINDDDRTVLIRSDTGVWAYTIIKNWIMTEEISILATYWNNFDSVYEHIGIEATQFLYRCIDITAPASNTDKRAELLKYLQAMFVDVASVQRTLPTIRAFLNADSTFKNKEVNYKKSNIYKNRDNPKVVTAYREELERRYEKMFFEEDSDRAAIVYNQAGFITTMDKMDWDLLIAFTLIKRGDEGEARTRQAWDKLEELIGDLAKT